MQQRSRSIHPNLILMQILTCVGSGLVGTEKGHSVIYSRHRLSYREQAQSWQPWPFGWTQFFKHVWSGSCGLKKSRTHYDWNLRVIQATSNDHLDTWRKYELTGWGIVFYSTQIYMLIDHQSYKTVHNAYWKRYAGNLLCNLYAITNKWKESLVKINV